MSRLTNKYAVKSTYQLIVDFLQSDGVACNFRQKVYDEMATYEGGYGYRKLFKTLNDKINSYHDLLCCLTGEKRANIYESIPSIDFLNLENTSLVSTYKEVNDSDYPIDNTVIVSQPVGDEVPALELIEEENQFTINRAVMGFNTAEHFYNTTGQAGSTVNLQVSPCLGDHAYIYKGVLTKKLIDDSDSSHVLDEYNLDTMQTNILCYKVTEDSPGSMSFNPHEGYKNVEQLSNITTADGKYLQDYYTKSISLNTIGNDEYGSFLHNGSLFAEKSGDKVVIHTNKNDIIVLIPTATYTSKAFPNKLLFFKSYKDEELSTVSAYIITSMEDDEVTLDPNVPENAAENSTAYYYYYDSESGKDKIYVYSNTAGQYVEFEVKDITVEDSINGCKKVKGKGFGIVYKLYVLLFDSYNLDFSSTFILNDLKVGDELPDFLKENFILSKIEKYLNIEKEYYADASGLLNGFFCEPKERNEAGDSSIVTKWKFCNDVDKAMSNGSSIEIGSKYNPGHLLYRGNILSSPLGFTEGDASEGESKHFKGKAELFYDTLFGGDNSEAKTIIGLFSSYMKDRSSWNNKNNSNFTINSLITKFDYSNRTFSENEAILLSGVKGETKPVKYINKFDVNGSIINASRISDYITSYNDRFIGDTLDLNNNFSNVECTLSTENRKRYWINNNTTRGQERDYSVASMLTNKRETAFVCEYTRVYKKNSSEVDSYKDISIKSINPMELFSKEGEDPETILVYPEYANAYPETMFLMSKHSLNLNNGDAAFLYNNGKFLSFTVSTAYDFSLDKLSYIKISYSGDVLTLPIFKGNNIFSNLFNIDAIRSCYVYILKPLKIKINDKQTVLYDWNNDEIKLDSDTDNRVDNRIIGASYPDDYFKVTTTYTNGVPSYKLKSKNNNSDINYLVGSTIISSLPTFSTLSELNNYKSTLSSVQKSFLDTFYTFLKNSATLKKIAKGYLLDLLGNWPISDKDTNPLYLKEVYGFLDNLERFATIIPTVVSGDFSIVIDDKPVTITMKDFEKLLARIEDNGTHQYSFDKYVVTIPKVWTEDEIKDMYSGDTSIKDIILNWLGSDISLVKETCTMYRKSFKAVKSVLNDFFGNGNVSKESCVALDEIFGEGTEPIVNIGETFAGREMSAMFTTVTSQLYSALCNLTYNACITRDGMDSSFVANKSSLMNLITSYYSTEKNGVKHFKKEAEGSTWSTYKLTIDPPEMRLVQKGLFIHYYKINLSASDASWVYPGTGIDPIAPIRFDSLINVEVLEGLADFLKTSLEGTNPDTKINDKFVTCLKDDKISGRENGLYFKRYNILNSRMNKLNGPLYQAGMLLRNIGIFEKADNIDTSNIEVYKDAISVIPISDIEPMTYLPPQTATSTTIELDGKYYSDKEMEALRNQIGSSCVLTCTVCKIKDSCPFYDQEEVIKMYCTGLESIDFWVKDNELELLDKDSFKLELKNEGDGFDMSEFDRKHLPYSDIMKTVSDKQVITELKLNELNKVREQLKSTSEDSAINLNYEKYVQDDLGWLLGGRYGVVEKNTVKDLDNESNADIKDALHDYKYLYNAVFIDMEDKDTNVDNTIPVIENDSYVDYRISSHEYDINFEVGAPGHKTKYSGTTKIKIPNTLKIFKYNNRKDDVYLVSDDTRDSEGLEIKPIIYLGKIGDIQLAFDLSDDGIPLGVTNENDTKLYAADVAQWCANYYKGCLAEDPIGYTGDEYKDRDQYWMDTVYKKINGRWIGFPGRRKVSSGYMDPIVDQNNMDEPAVISGHPVVNTYVDFVRKVSIRMYDPNGETEDDRWLIPFVNENMDLPWPDKTYKQNVEIQRKVLTLMKTNLRLVVVKQY